MAECPSTRFYASGSSSGRHGPSSPVCDLPDRIAAIAPDAGGRLPGLEWTADRPVPVLFIHGTAGRLAPYLNGQLGQDIPQWAADWAERNGRRPEPFTTEGGLVRVDCRENGEVGATVLFYRVWRMGRIWPRSLMGDPSDPMSHELVSSELISAFLRHIPVPRMVRTRQPCGRMGSAASAEGS